MEERFKKMSELEKYKFLCRYLYISLGFYATKYNYEVGTQGEDGSVYIGRCSDQGEEARRDLKYHEKMGINKDDFLK